MGRKPLQDKPLKVDTKIRIREDLKKEAIEKNINFSKVMDEALKKILKKK